VRTIDELGTFNDTVAKSNPTVRKLAASLRKLVSDIYPDVVEVPWPKLRVVGYGVGPKKSTEHFCYIGVYGTHVNLGFNHGLHLPDPNGILEGAGKKFRHVKIDKLEDVKKPALRRLLRAAVEERNKVLHKES
jgi:hypothetical protein